MLKYIVFLITEFHLINLKLNCVSDEANNLILNKLTLYEELDLDSNGTTTDATYLSDLKQELRILGVRTQELDARANQVTN